MRFLIASLGLLCLPLCAGEPTQDPILRIEAGMHTNTIMRIAADAAGRIAVTVSNDKTARVWDVGSGRLLRVLRPPMGSEDEGKLYAVAITRDGALTAVAGFTGVEWEASHTASIYFFETATGRLMSSIDGLPNVVNDLKFSPNDLWLGAGLSGGAGLGIWEVKTGRKVAFDSDYDETACLSLDWNANDSIVTACYDASLRLYNWQKAPQIALKLVEHDIAQDYGGYLHGYSARFSPDGRRIAKGYYDSNSVEILSSKDLLHSAFKNDPQKRGGLAVVAWGAGGKALIAGGSWPLKSGTESSDTVVRLWPDIDLERYYDIPIAKDRIVDLRTLPNDRFLFASGDPSWGVIDGVGTFKRLGESPIASYRLLRDAFRLSHDAATVAFAFQDFGKSPAIFDLVKRELSLVTERTQVPFALNSPRTEGVPIDDGSVNRYEPLSRALRLLFPDSDVTRSRCISSDASSYAVGTEFSLRYCSADGKKRWELNTPGVTWAVNLSGDGRLAVAALGDGTIRWYRIKDGKELLAFFPLSDRKRWVLWTPEGYYDASPGADDMIGWHVNRGKAQAADFFPASRFRAVYYRPDVVQRVLKTADTAEALRQANGALGRPVGAPEKIREVLARLSPPVVELTAGGFFKEVTLSKGARSVAVRYLIRQTGQEATTKVTVRFNGRPVSVAAPLPVEGKEAEVEVPLVDGLEGEVSIIAEHRFGASEAASLRVRRESGSAPPHKPDLYVIACGVAHLRANEEAQDVGKSTPAREEGVRKDLARRLSFQDLRFAGDDARKFANLFSVQEGRAYAHVIPTILVDNQATVLSITGALDEVQRKAQAGDVVLFFFSGHGHFTPESGYLLITHEAQVQNLATTALSGNDLARRLAAIRGSVVLALDTCNAGAALGGDKQVRAITGPGDLTGLVNQLSSSEQGVVVLSSSAEDQSSFEDEGEKQGLFTKAVSEGLTGKAVIDGRITCLSLQNWITKRVPELVKRLDSNAEQSPVCIMPKGVPDFTLAMLPGHGSSTTTSPFSNIQRVPEPKTERAESTSTGERFPQTHLRPLQTADLTGMNSAELRYAINEMFARHGADFSNPALKGQFLKMPWYRPRNGLTYDDVEQEFSEIEKENLLLLSAARDGKLGTPMTAGGDEFSFLSERTVTPDEVADWSIGRLRYAINHVYAKYGLTFRERAIQAEFEGKAWYRARPAVSMEEIDQIMSATEAANVKVLATLKGRKGTHGR